MDETESVVEELLERWRQADPDPVDVFEDQLVAQRGLSRHPDLPEEAWRRLRVSYLDALDEEHCSTISRT